jgi:hypothetical protein
VVVARATSSLCELVTPRPTITPAGCQRFRSPTRQTQARARRAAIPVKHAREAGSGTANVAVSAPLGALTASTTYHYHALALRGGSVAATGADQTFTTQSPPPPPAILSAPSIAGHTYARRRAEVFTRPLERSPIARLPVAT